MARSYAAGSDVAMSRTPLAGNETNRRDYSDLPVFDLITEHDDADTQIVCSAIYRMVCLMSGRPVPQAGRVLKQSKGSTTTPGFDGCFACLAIRVCTRVANPPS
jgi:hypothetical protein